MQLPTEAILESDYGQPDWQGRDKDVVCPLCGYRLWGTVEPHCPECGYSFNWSQVLNPALRLHPYLFEHHPERGLRAFVRTAFAGFRPRKFWTSLFPTQPSNPKRLIAYWMIAAAFPAVAAVVGLGVNVIGITRSGGLVQFTPAGVVKLSGVSTSEAIRDVFTSRSVQSTLATAVLLPTAWAWLCWVVSLIFQISMRRARVRPIHMLRVCIYSCDLAFWWGLFILAGTLASIPLGGLTAPIWFRHICYSHGAHYVYLLEPVSGVIALAFLFMFVHMTWRLRAGCKHYLQFRFPLATAVSVQIIVFLFVCTFLLASGLVR